MGWSKIFYLPAGPQIAFTAYRQPRIARKASIWCWPAIHVLAALVGCVSAVCPSSMRQWVWTKHCNKPVFLSSMIRSLHRGYVLAHELPLDAIQLLLGGFQNRRPRKLRVSSILSVTSRIFIQKSAACFFEPSTLAPLRLWHLYSPQHYNLSMMTSLARHQEQNSTLQLELSNHSESAIRANITSVTRASSSSPNIAYPPAAHLPLTRHQPHDNSTSLGQPETHVCSA